MKFNWEVDGIPCQVVVTHYAPGESGITNGPPELLSPPEEGELEVELYDLDDNRDRDLEEALTEDDTMTLFRHVEKLLEEEKGEAQIDAWEARKEFW